MRQKSGLKQLFEDHLSDLDVFFRMLSLLKDVKPYPRESVVVFDEVQQYPLERQPSLKAKGRLLRIGPDQGGHWEVAEGYAILVKV